jgi:hypothetical protein
VTVQRDMTYSSARGLTTIPLPVKHIDRRRAQPTPQKHRGAMRHVYFEDESRSHAARRTICQHRQHVRLERAKSMRATRCAGLNCYGCNFRQVASMQLTSYSKLLSPSLLNIAARPSVRGALNDIMAQQR